ncbi:hypothetical protein IE985_25075 [Klebsiella pneumoniae]|nr:hypothetical protein [Klebsiella pneumoniae]
MSEVKVNGSACCDRPGRAAFTVPAKDCRHSAGNAVSRPRSSSLRRVPAPFPLVATYHLFESIRRG